MQSYHEKQRVSETDYQTDSLVLLMKRQIHSGETPKTKIDQIHLQWTMADPE